MIDFGPLIPILPTSPFLLSSRSYQLQLVLVACHSFFPAPGAAIPRSISTTSWLNIQQSHDLLLIAHSTTAFKIYNMIAVCPSTHHALPPHESHNAQ